MTFFESRDTSCVLRGRVRGFLATLAKLREQFLRGGKLLFDLDSL